MKILRECFKGHVLFFFAGINIHWIVIAVACRESFTTSSSQILTTTATTSPSKRKFASASSKTNFTSKQTFAATTPSAGGCLHTHSRGPKRDCLLQTDVITLKKLLVGLNIGEEVRL